MKYLQHNLDSELTLMRDYKLKPDELFAIKVILLAQDGEYKYLQDYAELLEGRLRLILESLINKSIILKSYKLPKPGMSLVVEDIQFNQNFLKKFYRSAFEMGHELFDSYPQSTIVNGIVYNLKRVSKHFDSLEDAFAKYGKYIKYKPDTHNEVIELIKWGIDNGYNFTTLDSFIIDNGWLAIKAMRDGEGINVNTEAIKMI